MALTIEVAVERPARTEEGTVDRRAFSRHYEETFDRLVAFCRRQTPGEADPEAIAQEAFVRAWRAWDQFQHHRPFWPWIKTIAHRICIDEARKRERDGARRHLEATPAVDVCDAAAEVEKAVEYESAAAALRRLRPDHQRILNLADIDGWSYAEIADFEGVTVHSVRASLRRARASLRKTYGKLLDGLPAVVGLGWWRSLRRRVYEASARVQALGSSGGIGVERVGETLVGTVAAVTVVVMAAPSAAVAGTPADPAGAPPPVVAPDTDPLAETSDAAPVAAPGVGRQAAPAAGDAPGGTSPSSGGSTDGADRPSGPTSPVALPGTPDPRSAPRPEPSPPPDGGEEPEDASFHGFATPTGSTGTPSSPSSPSSPDADAGAGAGAGDTVVASGTVDDGCRMPPCQALFRSDDGGATWRRLPAVGFSGGQVMLPPTFPDDDRIFVASSSALLVSKDGGDTFLELVPVGGPAFMAPGFSTTDPRIFLGQSGGWVYDDSTGKTRPLALTPPPAGTLNTFATTPTFPLDDRLFVGGTAPSPHTPNATAVTTCHGKVCDAPVVLPGAIGTPEVAVHQRDGVTTVYAWRDRALFRSDDGGRSFERIGLPRTANVTDLEVSPQGDLMATLWLQLPDGSATGGLFRSSDKGDTWSTLGRDTPLAHGARAAAFMPHGMLLAAPVADAGGGVLCSADGGATWHARCGRSTT